MRLPVDTSELTLVVLGAAEPVLDFDTRQHKGDRDGVALYQVALALVGEDRPTLLTVKVAGEPSGLTVGGQVQVSGLVAQTWEINGRSGVAFRAERIAPASPAAPPSRAARPDNLRPTEGGGG